MPLELPERDPCPFCLNVAGTNPYPCAVIEDRGNTFAFVSPHQWTQGAVLVIPKRHARTILELTDEEAAGVMQCVVRMANAMNEALEIDGLNILQNNGELAYQSIPHVHFHVVPRHRGDGWRPSARPPLSPFEERQKIAQRIRSCL